MKEIQKPSVSPTEQQRKQGLKNFLYRDSIRRVFEYMLPLKSMQRKLQVVKDRRKKKISNREVTVFTYARA